MQNEQVTNVVRFGGFELDTSSGELTGGGGKIPLQDQPFQILKLLTERPGEVVTREEIRSRLWPDDTVVEFENAVNAAIKKLRIALGDSAEEPTVCGDAEAAGVSADGSGGATGDGGDAAESGASAGYLDRASVRD